MRFLVDTHVILWYLEAHPKLRKSHQRVLDTTAARGERVGLSAATLWEVAKLSEYQRIKLKGGLAQTLRFLEEHPFFEILPLSGDVALESTKLGSLFPKDPFDQIIVATARHYELELLTADERILRSQAMRCR